MKADEIKDRESLKAWLEARPIEDSQIIATRAALRVFPLWGAALLDLSARAPNLTTLTVMRALLIATVVSRFPEERVGAIANAGSTMADAAAKSAITVSADATTVFGSAAASASAASRAANALHSKVENNAPAARAAATAGAAHTSLAVKSIPDAVRNAFWPEVCADAKLIEEGSFPFDVALWSVENEKFLSAVDQLSLDALNSEYDDRNSFWHRWWHGMKRGSPLNWDLQKAVALEIPEEAWSDPKSVAAHIREIEARFLRKSGNDWLEDEVAKRPPPAKAQVKTTQAAMEQNHEALPPTFDAIEGLLLLEIERLQRVNDVNDAVLRHLRIYVELYEAIRLLRSQLPEQEPVSEIAAEKSLGILTLYMTKFSELPHAKVDEVVEGVYSTGKGIAQVGLIGVTTAIGVAYGLPAAACMAVGSMIFAPKNAADLIKAAREALPPLPKG